MKFFFNKYLTNLIIGRGRYVLLTFSISQFKFVDMGMKKIRGIEFTEKKKKKNCQRDFEYSKRKMRDHD